MNMIKNIIKGIAFYAAVLSILIGIGMNESFEKMAGFTLFGVATIFFMTTNTPESEIRKFTGVEWFKHKTGIDLLSD